MTKYIRGTKIPIQWESNPLVSNSKVFYEGKIYSFNDDIIPSHGDVDAIFSMIRKGFLKDDSQMVTIWGKK